MGGAADLCIEHSVRPAPVLSAHHIQPRSSTPQVQAARRLFTTHARVIRTFRQSPHAAARLVSSPDPAQLRRSKRQRMFTLHAAGNLGLQTAYSICYVAALALQVGQPDCSYAWVVMSSLELVRVSCW